MATSVTEGEPHSIQHGSNQPHLMKDWDRLRWDRLRWDRLRWDLRNSKAVEEADSPATWSHPHSHEPVTESRNLEHRDSQTLRLYCMPNTTQRKATGTRRCGSTWNWYQVFPNTIHYGLTYYIRNYVSSAAKTTSLNNLNIKNNKMFIYEKLRQTASKQFN